MKTFSIPVEFAHGYRLLRSPNIPVPHEIEIPILLICYELQNRMLFNHLAAVGLEGCWLEHRAEMDHLILATLHLWDGTDETNDLYLSLMDRESEDVTMEEDEVIRRAIRIHDELVKRREGLDPSFAACLCR
jgi:hypothetical protein